MTVFNDMPSDDYVTLKEESLFAKFDNLNIIMNWQYAQQELKDSLARNSLSVDFGIGEDDGKVCLNDCGDYHIMTPEEFLEWLFDDDAELPDCDCFDG